MKKLKDVIRNTKKICIDCNKKKKLTEFYQNNRKRKKTDRTGEVVIYIKDDYRPQCKDCWKQYQRMQYRRKVRENIIRHRNSESI